MHPIAVNSPCNDCFGYQETFLYIVLSLFRRTTVARMQWLVANGLVRTSSVLTKRVYCMVVIATMIQVQLLVECRLAALALISVLEPSLSKECLNVLLGCIAQSMVSMCVVGLVHCACFSSNSSHDDDCKDISVEAQACAVLATVC